MIGLYGSPSQFDEKMPSPRLRFALAKACWSRRMYTRSRPAMTSELHPATQGAKKPQTWNRSNRENTWIAITEAPLATPENVLPAGIAVARRDSRNVRPVVAPEERERTVDSRPRAYLFLLAVRAERRALRADVARVARLLDDLPEKERVGRIDARIEDGDDLPVPSKP